MSDSESPDVGKPMVQYEEHDEGRVAVITLDRPEARNAQNNQVTYELNDAFPRAAFTDSVKCIVLAANGPHSEHLCETGTDMFPGAGRSRTPFAEPLDPPGAAT